MQKEQEKTNPKDVQYVVYDRTTGRILGSHRCIDGITGEAVELSPEQVLSDCGLANDGSAGMDVLQVASADLRAGKKMRVNLASRKLEQRSKIEIVPAKTELAGDGKDKVELQIKVLDAAGKTDTSFTGRIKVSTQRGRLDAKGGQVDLKAGQGSVTLRSVDESVDSVMVRAMDAKGECDPGYCTLAFV